MHITTHVVDDHPRSVSNPDPLTHRAQNTAISVSYDRSMDVRLTLRLARQVFDASRYLISHWAAQSGRVIICMERHDRTVPHALCDPVLAVRIWLRA